MEKIPTESPAQNQHLLTELADQKEIVPVREKRSDTKVE
jgi:hypothetical protein